jgi:hypothetical protein
VNFAVGIDHHVMCAAASRSFSTHQSADMVIASIFNGRIILGN